MEQNSLRLGTSGRKKLGAQASKILPTSPVLCISDQIQQHSVNRNFLRLRLDNNEMFPIS